MVEYRILESPGNPISEGAIRFYESRLNKIQQLDLLIRLCRDKTPHLEAYRSLFYKVITRNHERLNPATEGSRELFKELCAFGQFEIPSVLPDKLTVWRGGAGVTFEQLRVGYYWWCSPLFSSGYAMSSAEILKADPLVIKAEIDKSELDYFIDDAPDIGGEILILNPPKSVVVDGTPEEWKLRQKQQFNIFKEKHGQDLLEDLLRAMAP